MVSDHASNAGGGSRGEKTLLSRRVDAETTVNAEVRLIAGGVMDNLAERYGRRFALEVAREVLVQLAVLAMLDAEGTS